MSSKARTGIARSRHMTVATRVAVGDILGPIGRCGHLHRLRFSRESHRCCTAALHGSHREYPHACQVAIDLTRSRVRVFSDATGLFQVSFSNNGRCLQLLTIPAVNLASGGLRTGKAFDAIRRRFWSSSPGRSDGHLASLRRSRPCRQDLQRICSLVL